MNTPARRGRQVPADDVDEAGFFREHRAGVGALFVVLSAAAAGWAIWSRTADSSRMHPESVLRPEAVELIGQPSWMRRDLKAEALRNASLDGGLPLDDPELPRRLARAFDMHPWVARVVSVKLRHPAAATVEVVCRDPVAMVAVKGGLLAVDADAVVLPSDDFSAESAARYPRITGVHSSPQGPEGAAWGDRLVEEAAALASVIGPEWESLGLTECRPVGNGGTATWELVGPANRTIVFGAAPGREVPGEPSAAVKIARLRRVAEQPASDGRIDLTESPGDETAGSGAISPRSIPSP